jgi:hypothetical protein
MEKCGLRYEGTLKESDQNNQGICDASWYALLRKDYLSTKYNIFFATLARKDIAFLWRKAMSLHK